MKRLILFFLMIFIGFNVSGQNRKKDQETEIVNHTVELGESVRLISKKYLVDPAEIYKLNKFAVNGVSQGMVLRIPVPVKDDKVIVQQEETQNNEPVATETTPIEETPVAEAPKKTETKPKKAVEPKREPEPTPTPAVVERSSETTHTVEPKETLYSLSRKYGVTVDQLKATNPELVKGLKIGQVIQIPSSDGNAEPVTAAPTTKPAPVKSEPVQSQPKVQITEQVDNSSSGNVITHTVAPKETLYSLSKKYNITVDDIKNQNEALLHKGLQIGQVLTIRKN